MEPTQPQTTPTQDPPLKRTYDWMRKKNSRFVLPYEEFERDMADDNKRRQVHKWLSDNNSAFRVDFDTFSSDMGFKKKDSTAPSSQPAETASPVLESGLAQQPLNDAGKVISQNFDPDLAKLAAIDPATIGRPFDPESIRAEYEAKRAEEGRARDVINEISFGKEKPGAAQIALDDPLKAATQAVSSFNKAVVSGASSVPKTVGVIAKQLDDFFGTGDPNKKTEDYATYKAGQWLDDKAREWGITATDPNMDDSFWLSAVPQGLGSVASIILLGGPKGFGRGPAGPLTPQGISQGAATVEGIKDIGAGMASRASAAGSMAMAVPEFEAAKRAGKSDSEAFKVFLLNYGVGATEVLPIERALSRINKISNGKLSDVILAGIPGGLEEGLQETVQTVLTNKIAEGTYDPKRDTFQDVLTSAGAGFFVGFILPGIGAAMQNMTPDQREATKVEINNALKSYEAPTGKQADEQAKAQAPATEGTSTAKQPAGDSGSTGTKPVSAKPQPSGEAEATEGTPTDSKAQDGKKTEPVSKEPTTEDVQAEPADLKTEWSGDEVKPEVDHDAIGKQVADKEVDQETFSDSKGKKYKVIGKNADGETVGEDDNGVRAVTDGKIIRNQPVNVIPGRGITVDPPKGKFLTTEEQEGMDSIQDDDDVPEYEVIPRDTKNLIKGKKFDYLPNKTLSESDKEIESLFAEDLNDNYDQRKKEYFEKFGNVLDADYAKELSDTYKQNPRKTATAVHNPGSSFLFRVYTDTLKEPAPAGKENRITFIVGGAAAGKSTLTERIKESDKSQLFYNTFFGETQISKNQINRALNAGKDVGVKYVYRDPVESFRSMLKRAEGDRRIVPISVFVNGHIDSKNTIDKIREEYKGNPRVNIETIGSPKDIDRGSLLSQLKGVTDELLRNGEITEDQYNQLNETPQPTKAKQSEGRTEVPEDTPEKTEQVPAKEDVSAKGKLKTSKISEISQADPRVQVVKPSHGKTLSEERKKMFEEAGDNLPKTLSSGDLSKTDKSEDPHDKFIADVAPRIGTEELNKNSLRKIASQYGIDNDNHIKELTEVAIVNRARQIIATGKVQTLMGNEDTSYENLVELYQNQPTLSHRTSSSVMKQQYSTPVPIGYLAGKYVNADKGGKVFEPSAGNGMLTIVADPKNVTVNEIDEFRSENLNRQPFAEILNVDGSAPFNRDKQFDAVITNPPFGGTDVAVIDGFKFNELAQIMSVRALETMKDKGKAAIIIGGNNEFDDKGRLSGRDRIYFNYLYNRYNVDDVIDISGDLYRKQGASFPIRLILINGRKATPSGVAPGRDGFGPVVKSFNELKPRVEKFFTEQNLNPDENENLQPTELVGGTDATSDSGSGKSRPKDVASTTQEPSGATVSRTGEESDRGRPESTVSDSGSVGGTEPSSGGPQRNNGLDPEFPGVSPTTEQQGQQDGGSTQTQSEGTTPAVRRNRPGADRKIVEGALSEQSGSVDYAPTSKGKSMSLKIPSSMSQEMYDAMSRLKEEVGDIDSYVQKKLAYKNAKELHNALSAEQIDGVALAIWNIENGDAVIIGDQTGIGKGRQAAAVIRYGVVSGRKPIFLTEKPNLFAAIYRDLKAIGSGDYKPFIVNNIGDKFNGIREKDEEGKVIHKAYPSGHPEHKKVLVSMQVPEDCQVVMATYSQFGNPKYVDKINFIKAIAQDNIIILDESHNASGVESNTGLVFQEALPTSKGVVFLSGTYAKRPDNMPVYAMKTAMKESNMETEELINAIVSGGTALQEIISGQLAESGQLIRRQRSYDNVEVRNNVLVDQAEEHRKASDTITDLVRDIIRFQSKYVAKRVDQLDAEAAAQGEIVTQRGGTNMAGVDNAPYFSKVFNVIDQMLYSIKAKATAEEAIRLLKAGKKPFIAIRGTLESNLSDLLESGDVKYGDTIEADFSYILQKGLDGVLRITVKDASGNKSYEVIKPEELGSAGFAEYNRIADKIKASTSGLSMSPIDELVQTIQKAGYTIGEVTGRQSRLVLSSGKKRVGILERKKREPVDVAYRKYNSGEYDVLIVNSSGSTGEDAHADAKFKDKRQRVELVLQPELNINTLMQIIGRVNRTGQVSNPEYQFVNSAIPAEQRLMAMTMRKLKSLDANTTSNQKQSKGVLDVPEFFNKYGDRVVIEYLQENTEVIDMIGDPLNMLNNEDLEPSKPKDAALRVSGRVAILPVKEQEKFYNEIIDRYAKQLEYLNDAGINDLEVTNLPLRAKTISKQVTIVGKGGKTAFGDDTYLEEVEVDVLRKPLTRSEIDEQISQLSGKNPAEHTKMLYDEITAYAERLQTSLDEEYARDLEEEIADIQSKDKLTDAQKLEHIDAARSLSSTRLANKKSKEAQRIEYVKSLFRFFTPGKAVRVPTLLKENQDASAFYYSDGIFMGFDIDLKKPKPFLPSNIRLRFAVNDGRVSIPIPASKTAEINYIRTAAYEIAPDRAKAIQEWDSLKKPKGREKRMMVTGNLLQGLSKFDGKIIKYTTEEGFIQTGILLPEGFDVRKAEEAQEISVPATKVVRVIENANRYAEFPSADGKVKITAQGANRFTMRVPLSKSKGGKYFTDPDLLDLVDGNNFNSVGQEMEARFPGERLAMVLDVLQNKFGTSFVLPKQQFEKALQNQEIEMTQRSGDTFEPVAQLSLFPWLTPSKVKKKPVNQVAEDALRKEIEMKNAEAEKRYREASGPSPQTADGRWQNIKDSFSHMITGFTSHFKYLNPRKFPREAAILRVFETVKKSTAERAKQYMQGLVEPLTKEQYDIFTRRIVLEDLLGGIEKGLENPDRLPFGFNSTKEVEREIQKFTDLMQKEPAAQEAYDQRQTYMDTMYQALVDKGILTPEEDRKTYYHRRVLQYMEEEENQRIIHGKRLSKAYKDWRRARTGTKGKDYSTNFIESEYRVVSEGLYELEKQRILNELMGPFESALRTLKRKFNKQFQAHIMDLENEFGKNSDEVKAYKSNKRSMMKAYIDENKPTGSTFYQPTPGNAIFVRKLVSQEAIEKAVQDAGLTEASGTGAAMQLIENIIDMADPMVLVGQRRKEYLVPKELADELEFMGTNTQPDPNLLSEITSAWKVYVLLNPNRFVKYNINNFFGDIDGTLAADPSIFKKVGQAWRELREFKNTGRTTSDLNDAIRHNVIDSGWELTELADINNAKWAQFFSDQGKPDLQDAFGNKIYRESAEIIRTTPGKIWNWYWDKVKSYTRIRENVLRYAAYLRAKEKVSNGETFYWASNPTEIDGITDPIYRAGKLSREVLGDYGNISQTGQRIRRYMIPFYSWMEINMGRYYRLIRNASSPAVQARIMGVMAKRGITAVGFRMMWGYALMGLMTALVEAWNWFRFPEETEKMRRANTRGMQLILGTTDDGKVVALPIVGAFYDFLDFFGLPDMKDDLALIFSGESPKKGLAGAGKTFLITPFSKTVQAVNPFLKSGYELITGGQLFPDPRNPRPIYDYKEYFAQFLSLQDEYRALTGTPTRHPYFFGHIRNLVVRDIDPDELSYFMARRIVETRTGKKFDFEPNEKSTALYRYGLSIRYGQTEEALKWMNEYYRLGGTPSGLNASLRGKDPLSKLPRNERFDVQGLVENPTYKPETEFGKGLTPKEIKIFRDAIRYYDRTYDPNNVPM